MRLLSVAPEIGPEHIAFGPDGKLYTGVLSGAILRMDPDGRNVETFVNTGGRPLGLDFDATGQLIVADALRGLLVVEPGGRVSVLEGALTQGPVEYADAVQVARDGRILFTDASQRLTPKKYGTFDAALLDILEHSCTGRVLEFDPCDVHHTHVVGGLCFPNGIASHRRRTARRRRRNGCPIGSGNSCAAPRTSTQAPSLPVRHVSTRWY